MKYKDVYKDIREKIQKKSYSPWTSLEGEEILGMKYGVSRTTVRKAITHLKNEGYIHSRQGSGIYVNPPEFYEEKNITTLSERIEENKDIKNIILKYQLVDADDHLSEIFNLPLGTKLIYYTRLRKINDVPQVLEETYMPQYLFENFHEETAKGSVIRYIEEACGYKISHDIKNVKAISLTKDLSTLLEIEDGTPTLQIEHKVYLIKSLLAQYTREIQTKNNIRFVSVR